MHAPGCTECVNRPVMTCGRCSTTHCEAHALPPGRRCDRCERDWDAELATRRAAKLMFAPPISIFAAGLLFLLLLPVSLGGAIGAAALCAVACATAATAGVGTCRLVEHSARAMFLRERAGSLPTARLLPSPRQR